MEPNLTALMLVGMASGVLASFLVQILKGRLNGKPAYYFAMFACFIVAIGIAVVSGVSLPNPGNDPIQFISALATVGSVSFTIAQTLYKAWLSKWQSGAFSNQIPSS